MDYKKLLALAEQKQDELNAFRAKKATAKNASRGPDPAAIANFKARLEREKRERMERSRREREHLLMLRAQNSKSVRKSKVMSTRTKDNDFSTIVVSEHEARENEKVEAKISKAGVKGKVARTKARIEMDQKLAGLTRRERDKVIADMERAEPTKVFRPRKPTIAEIIAKSKAEASGGSGSSASNRPKAPPLSYDQLLSLAEEKSKIKVSLEDYIREEIKDSQQRQRPMTAKEKERFSEEQYYRNRSANARLPAQSTARKETQINNNMSNNNNNNNLGGDKRKLVSRPPASHEQQQQQQQEPDEPYEPEPYEPAMYKQQNVPNGTTYSSHNQNNNKIETQQYRPSMNGRNDGDRTKEAVQANAKYKPSARPPSESQYTHQNNRLSSSSSSSSNGRIGSESINRNRMPPPPPPAAAQTYKSNSSSQARSSSISSSSRLTGQGQQASFRNQSQQSRPNANIRANSSNRPIISAANSQSRFASSSAGLKRQSPPIARPKLPPIGATYRRGMYRDYEPEPAEEDDEEYEDEEEDDEMADFIDDGPEEEAEEPEYLREIRQMFGYDSRKYRIEDDDDDDIEVASFSQCMKEEKESLRAGILEDLEDIRREEEEERAKAARRKAKLRAMQDDRSRSRYR